MWFSSPKDRLILPSEALPGRAAPVVTALNHAVNGAALKGPYPDHSRRIIFGMGCYWGAERLFWQTAGVIVTAVGNAGGFTPNPTYEEVCSGATGHTEVVQVVYDPQIVSTEALLALFWQSHDPTQGLRQGNDRGSQYRSAIYWTTPAQRDAALASRDCYQAALTLAGYGPITTEIAEAGPFYFAEDYHQQYLAKNPQGYCGLGGTGVSCAPGTFKHDAPHSA